MIKLVKTMKDEVTSYKEEIFEMSNRNTDLRSSNHSSVFDTNAEGGTLNRAPVHFGGGGLTTMPTMKTGFGHKRSSDCDDSANSDVSSEG